MKPKEGILMVSNNGIMFKLGPIFEQEGQRMVQLTMDLGGTDAEVPPPIAVRHVVEYVRNGTWKIVKDGPIEPEKILKQFNFI